MGVDDEYSEALKLLMPRGGQRQPICDPVAHLVRTGDHLKRQGEVAHAPRHRSDHSQVPVKWQWRQTRRRVPAKRHEPKGWLVSVDATIVRGYAQRTTDVRAERQRPKTGSERCGRPAGGTARRAAEIPRVCWSFHKCRCSFAN